MPPVCSAPLRVWAGPVHGVDFEDRGNRLGLSPVLRAHLDDRFDEDELAARYGSLRTAYQLTGPDEAEVALLPRAYERSTPEELRSLLVQAEARGLRTLVFAGGDLEPVMPADSVILLHPGPTRGAQPRADVLALPYLFDDRAESGVPRPDRDRPSVGFCGQGTSRPVSAVGQALSRAARVVVNRVRPTVVPPPVRGHLGLRSTALRELARHPGVDDRFVIRNRYRAGAASEEERALTQAEFDDNVRSATYTLCVRGTGNFSARFCEALSFGRVPLFVDTNCVLPLEDQIDWRAHTVWIDAGEVDAIGDRLVSAHAEVRADADRGAVALRRLWEERLSQDGFFAHLPVTVRRLL